MESNGSGNVVANHLCVLVHGVCPPFPRRRLLRRLRTPYFFIFPIAHPAVIVTNCVDFANQQSYGATRTI